MELISVSFFFHNKHNRNSLCVLNIMNLVKDKEGSTWKYTVEI